MLKELQMEVLGWAYAYACAAIDKGIDLRKVAVGDFIAAAERDLNT